MNESFEVIIRYTGQVSYGVTAKSREEAEEKARALYQNGDHGNHFGTDHEDIEEVVVKPIVKGEAR